MNAAQQMLARGATILAKQSGQAEEFTFGSKTVSANCDRRQSAPQLQGIINATTESGAVIWWPLSATPLPTQGDSLEDANDEIMSVRRAYHVGHSIELVCAVVK